MSSHLGERTLAERVAAGAAEPLLRPVWVQDSGQHVPGVLLRWERRLEAWHGLVAYDAGRGLEQVWVPANWLQPIRPR
jgi:hypothetical protein